MRLEPTKFERLKAEIEGSEEYLEGIRQSAKRKVEKLENFGMAHTGYKANEKIYLERGIEYLAKEEEKTIEKINDLEERLSKEDEPEEKEEQLEIGVSAHRAGVLGVTRGLASIGLSWKDIAEVCDDYDSLLGEGVPPAIYDKDNSKVSKRGGQIKIEGRRRDVELEKQIERERIENTKRQGTEPEETQREVEEQSSKTDEAMEQEEPAEVDSIKDEQVEISQLEEIPENIDEISNVETPEVVEEVPNIEEPNCSEAESIEEVDEAVEEFMPEEIEGMLND